MGMDGLSMSNTGMLREATSRDFAAQTEEAVHRDESNKQVDKLQTQMRVKEDGRNGSGGANGNKKKKDDKATSYETEDETGIDSVPVDKLEIPHEELENHSFYVKITEDGNIFELYDKESDRLVEKIGADEVSQLINKLNLASGILVNRSV